MQSMISKEQLLEKINLLNPSFQQMVAAFVDGLLKTQSTVAKRDKSRLVSVSVWSDEDIQPIQEAQIRINAWQLPVF